MSQIYLKFRVKGQGLCCTNATSIVSDAVNIVKAQFTFDNIWTDLSKLVTFTNTSTNVSVSVILLDNECYIPYEALADEGELIVCVYGGSSVDGVVSRIYTKIDRAIKITKSDKADSGLPPSSPPQSVYDQMVEIIDTKGDTLSYVDDILSLKNKDVVLSSVMIQHVSEDPVEVSLSGINQELFPTSDLEPHIAVTKMQSVVQLDFSLEIGSALLESADNIVLFTLPDELIPKAPRVNVLLAGLDNNIRAYIAGQQATNEKGGVSIIAHKTIEAGTYYGTVTYLI